MNELILKKDLSGKTAPVLRIYRWRKYTVYVTDFGFGKTVRAEDVDRTVRLDKAPDRPVIINTQIRTIVGIDDLQKTIDLLSEIKTLANMLEEEIETL